MPWPDLFSRRQEEDEPTSSPASAPTFNLNKPTPPEAPPTRFSASPPRNTRSTQPESPSATPTSSHSATTPLLHSPLKVTALTSILGLTFGSTSALFRHSPTPTLFALATSIQWGALGGTYAFVRGRGLLMAEERSRHLGVAEGDVVVGASEKARISGIAGAAAGAVGGAIRGRIVNIVAGAGVFGVVGWVGQAIISSRDSSQQAETHLGAQGRLQASEQAAGETRKESAGMIERMAKSKWNPMRKLTDEEYEDMLREKLIRVEAEIAVVDEEIVALEGMARREAERAMCAERQG